MAARISLPAVPASFFGIVLGLCGLGNAWRAAHRVWGLPALPGEALMLLGTFVWAILMVLYCARWISARPEVVAELGHPVQCCFVGLIGVATMLVALGVLPYGRLVAGVLVAVGAAFTLTFGLWRTGLLWRGERDAGATTAVLYLPTVAGMFVTATAAAAFGLNDWGQLAFGAGFFSWIAIESVLLHRLYTAASLPPALRPTLGIQLAPPAVGAVAYLSVAGGHSDVAAHALLGYGLLQGLILLRLLPWIREQPFGLSYWAFTFGATALATAPLRMIETGDAGAVASIAPFLFAAANLVVLVIAFATVRFLALGLRPRAATVPQ